MSSGSRWSIEKEAQHDLADYINGLPGFTLFKDRRPPGERAYGALLTDAILQAGLNYERVVHPRALRVRDVYPKAATTSGFLNVLEVRGYPEVLQWKDALKPDRVKRLATFFQDQNVETVEELQKWVGQPQSRKELLAINGVGPKTADYIAWLAGIPVVAVDRHITRFCAEAGIVKRNFKKAARDAAVELGVDEGCLDYSIWFYMSRRGKLG